MANQEMEKAQIEKASDLVTKAYHEENINTELNSIPVGERKDIIDKMRQIDKAVHGDKGDAKVPNLEIVESGGESWIGVKGEKVRDSSVWDYLNLAKPINNTEIMKERVVGTDGKPGSIKWVGHAFAPESNR